MKAEKFSNLPCPYWWSASAGLSETRTEKNVIRAAIRSNPEWAASDKIPSEPVAIPTTIFRLVITKAASTEFPATARFSRRIDSELKVARISDINVIIALESPAANPLPAFALSPAGHATMTFVVISPWRILIHAFPVPRVSPARRLGLRTSGATGYTSRRHTSRPPHEGLTKRV